MAKAPGKSHRKGITFKQLLRKSPPDEKSAEWIVRQRWPKGVCCPNCGSLNVQTDCQHKTMPFRCREKVCASRFSTKTGTVMEGSKIGYRYWIVAAFLVVTSLKSVSSMKLHRDLGITQKSAWFLAQRLRAALSEDAKLFSGPVEADETYIGGKDRETNRVATTVIRSTDADTTQGFVKDPVDSEAAIWADDERAYETLSFEDDTVKHSLQEYVTGDGHPNGFESLWSLLERAHTGTFPKLSPKHLDRYVQELAGCHNMRDLDTINQIEGVRHGMEGKRLTSKALIKGNGLKSGAGAMAVA